MKNDKCKEVIFSTAKGAVMAAENLLLQWGEHGAYKCQKCPHYHIRKFK